MTVDGVQQWLQASEFLDRMPRITTREGLAQLRARGVPCRKSEKGYEYPWPAAGIWYLEDVERTARGEEAPDFKDARARKTQAEAALAELELAKARGEVVDVNDVTREVERVFERLRASIQAVPGKWAPQLMGLSTVATASALLTRIGNELLETMSSDGEQENA